MRKRLILTLFCLDVSAHIEPKPQRTQSTQRCAYGAARSGLRRRTKRAVAANGYSLPRRTAAGMEAHLRACVG